MDPRQHTESRHAAGTVPQHTRYRSRATGQRTLPESAVPPSADHLVDPTDFTAEWSIAFRALAGWVTSMIAGTDQEQGWLENIIVGIIGAFLGGFLFGLLTGRETYFALNVGSFIVAVIGAVVLLFILRMVRRA